VNVAVYRDDPYPAFNFLVTVDGISEDGGSAKGAFSEVSGLGLETSVIEYRTGSDRMNTVRKLPGVTKYTNVQLKRGILGDLAFWQWVQSVVQGQPFRASVRITLLDEQRNPVLTWRLARAWPCKYTGPSLNAKTSEVAIETLEIAHEGLEIE
jgi:phage tail-like protein